MGYLSSGMNASLSFAKQATWALDKYSLFICVFSTKVCHGTAQ